MTTALSRDVSYYREVISESWHRTVKGVLETAHLLVEAYNSLGDEEWDQLKSDLPFKDSVRSMMMSIGDTKRFNKISVQKRLPPNYNILYEFSKLDDDEWDQAIDEGLVDTDTTTSAVRKWKSSIHYPQTTKGSGATSSTSKANYFAHIPSVDDLDPDTKKEVLELVYELDENLKELGVEMLIENGNQSSGTPRQQSIENAKQTLKEKLQKEVSKELEKFNTLPRKDIDEIESAYYQHRFYQTNNQYPYDPSTKGSIERDDHPYSISDMDFSTFMKVVRSKKVITQWTPIREWRIAGKAKCIKLALEHTTATTNNQRANYKKQLKNIISRNDKNSTHAQKYLDMLVE